MVSLKRRRGIGLRQWLILALKKYAKEQGLPSHTKAVSMILRGDLKPLQDYEKYKIENDKRLGVSMQEELWLALKDYATKRNKKESDTKVACKILVGMIDPIPKECLKVGQLAAIDRERERAKTSPAEPATEATKPAVDEKAKHMPLPAPAKLTPKDLEEVDQEATRWRDSVDSGTAHLDTATQPPPANPAPVKSVRKKREPKQKDTVAVQAEPEHEVEVKKTVGRPLSKGVPISEDKTSGKKIDPDDDFYGGVFNM